MGLWNRGSMDLKKPHFLKLKTCFGEVGFYKFLWILIDIGERKIKACFVDGEKWFSCCSWFCLLRVFCGWNRCNKPSMFLVKWGRWEEERGRGKMFFYYLLTCQVRTGRRKSHILRQLLTQFNLIRKTLFFK